MKEEENKGIILECKHCGNKWTYRGKHKYNASCSDCHNAVRIPNKK